MTAKPRVSVVVRSFGRLPALAELLEALLRQTYDSYEVVVVEQTVDGSSEDRARVEALVTDPRVRIFYEKPLGGPAARNYGVERARGTVVLLIDDDDLPVDDGWVADMAQYFDDPSIVGVTGRYVLRVGEACPYHPAWKWWLRLRCMRYSFFKTPHQYARLDQDAGPVGWVHGTNGALRKELVERAGYWDTSVRSEDEHSFAFKAQRVMRANERFVYRALPMVLRRSDIAGGMDKRFMKPRRFLENQLRYCHRVVGEYFPVRFALAYPYYLLWSLHKTLERAWSPRRESGLLQRLVDIGDAFFWLPFAVYRVAVAERRDEKAAEASGAPADLSAPRSG